MLLGPVFNAEMVANGRRKRYFLLRVLFALGLLLCLWFCYLEASNYNDRSGRLPIDQAAKLASSFFWAFAWVTMIAALVVTPAIAAGAIASERERRTIEYLFATDLSNAEIVLSKLAGKLLLVGKLVLVALPVLAIFRLLGGIPGNLLVMYFASLASTVTMLTVGAICISVWTPRARDAVIRVYLVEALVFVLPFVFGVTIFTAGVFGKVGWVMDLLGHLLAFFMRINPLTLLFSQMSMTMSGMQVDSSAMWQMIGLQSATSVVLALLAVAAVRRVHLRSISGGDKKQRQSRWFPSLRYRPPLGEHPMLWKELFARSAATKLGLLGRVAIALLMIAMAIIAIAAYISVIDSTTNAWQSPGEMYLFASVMITLVWGVGMAILMGLRAAGLITYEKERDCWLSLISTPLTGQDIVGAKAIGNLYAFRWLIAPLALVWLLQLTLSPQYVVAIPLQLLAIGVSGLFATAVGLAFSLNMSTSLKSIGATMGSLFFIGGGYLLCCCFPLFIGGDDDDMIKVAMIMCVPFLIAAPGPFIVQEFNTHEAWIMVDYVLGIGIYSIASLVILSTLVARFEELAGRSGVGGPPTLGDLQAPRSFAPPATDTATG